MSATLNISDLSLPAGPSNRMLAYGIALSIGLHIGALLVFPGMRQGAPEVQQAKVLTATISSRIASPQAARREPEPKPEVQPPPPPPKPEPPRPVQKAPPVLTSPVPTPAPPAPRVEATPPAPVPPPAVAQPPAPPAPPAPPVAAAPAQAPRATAPSAPASGPAAEAAKAGSDTADAGSLDRYRMAIIVAARRYKRYPAVAMEKGWQGKVEIRMLIGANGMIQTTTVKTSSGHQILDDTALDMVKKAKPMTQIPTALRGKEFTVDVPVIFDLQSG